MCGRALLHPRDLAPGCDEGAVVIPTSSFSTAAQNADPSHHRYLDRCTHSTPFCSMSNRSSRAGGARHSCPVGAQLSGDSKRFLACPVSGLTETSTAPRAVRRVWPLSCG